MYVLIKYQTNKIIQRKYKIKGNGFAIIKVRPCQIEFRVFFHFLLQNLRRRTKFFIFFQALMISEIWQEKPESSFSTLNRRILVAFLYRNVMETPIHFIPLNFFENHRTAPYSWSWIYSKNISGAHFNFLQTCKLYA